MMDSSTYRFFLTDIITAALKEDVGPGDFTSLATIDVAATGKAQLKIKQAGILAGVAVAQHIFEWVDRNIVFQKLIDDGAPMQVGDIAFEVSGSVQTILKCERFVLNTMQRMCGIATLTQTYVQALEGYKTKLLDTRKTTPNFRLLEKEAVRIGGAYNHRFGLYDMIMIKDNHIDFCGGITPAIHKTVAYLSQHNLNLAIEVEARSLDDVQTILDTGNINRIMLDNFTPENLQQAVTLIDGRYETEASGGITLDNIKTYAQTGVDFISSGAIIHQAKSLDLSLKAKINNG